MTAAEAREAGEAPATERPQPVAGAGVETGSTPVTDPFAEPPAPNGRFLHALNPLAKLAAPLPAIVVLVVTRGLAIPTALLLLALAVLFVGARLRARTVVLLVVGLPPFVAVLGATLGVWVDPRSIEAGSPGASVVLIEVGGWQFTLAAYLIGLATALRISALLVLSLIAGLTTTGPDLVRALVQNLRVPYRVGYAALAALRFVPRFRHELEVIRSAQRVRGVDRGRGPVAAVRRTLAVSIPLLAGAIRHAERVALAMDARAFGAHPTRTERTLSRWRVRDTVFVVLFWAATAAVTWWGLAGR